MSMADVTMSSLVASLSTSGNESSVAEGFRFLDLPAELRMNVLRRLPVDELPIIIVVYCKGCQPRLQIEQVQLCSQVLTVCKCMLMTGTEILYTENLFELRTVASLHNRSRPHRNSRFDLSGLEQHCANRILKVILTYPSIHPHLLLGDLSLWRNWLSNVRSVGIGDLNRLDKARSQAYLEDPAAVGEAFVRQRLETNTILRGALLLSLPCHPDRELK
jgi:hypothetical protein